MNIDRLVMTWAGIVILVSLLLYLVVSPYWLLLTAFAGINMLQASFTGFCPVAILMKKMGVKPGVVFK